MATKKVSDAFSNMASILNVESAANTLTYKKLETSFGTFEKIAWVIHRIDYYWFFDPGAVFNSTADNTICALMTGNQRSTLQTSEVFTDPQVIDMAQMKRTDLGAAASGLIMSFPATRDFSSLPSGGLIVPPAPLYGAIQASGAASVTACVLRVYYTIKELATDEYWELVEARRLLTA
jgi:hypothetical protein